MQQETESLKANILFSSLGQACTYVCPYPGEHMLACEGRSYADLVGFCMLSSNAKSTGNVKCGLTVPQVTRKSQRKLGHRFVEKATLYCLSRPYILR